MSDSPASPFSVIYLPGMQGRMLGDRWLTQGLKDAGLSHVQTFNWPRSLWPLRNLRDRAMHDVAADHLLELIAAERQYHPDRAVVLIGHSTGAMVILDALTRLDQPQVEQAWLIAAAVSCGYDLVGPLAGVKQMVSVHSPWDWAVLGAGTRLFGTADGLNEDAAGFRQFTGPGCDDPRLHQMAYDPAWARTGHLGGHLGPLNRFFARQIMGPMILNRAFDPEPT